MPYLGSQSSRISSRKEMGVFGVGEDKLQVWMSRYQLLAIEGVRSAEVAAKIELHLERFQSFLASAYAHDRISTLVRRDVVEWQQHLAKSYAPSTVNGHLASLSGFTSWVAAHTPDGFPLGDPTSDVPALALPALEPRSLNRDQVRSLKNLCDRLERFAQQKGRRHSDARDAVPTHKHARPRRDRAIVFVMLSTGLRRSELVDLDLEGVVPSVPSHLRSARRARLVGVRGKGGTQRTVFLSADARAALAGYLESERPQDVAETSTAVFLTAGSVASRRPDGRLSARSVNSILERIGRLHDSEYADTTRHVSPLRPHDLRHTFAFGLAEATGADAYELERRLGHRSQRYIARYTNPPEEVAAGYVEDM